MDALPPEPDADLSARLDRLQHSVASDPERLDREAEFPPEWVALWHEAGLLAAPVPARQGGAGPAGLTDRAAGACALLRRMGRISMPAGRVFEGHVNALRLIALYGDAAQADAAAADAAAGHLFAVWIAEHPARPVIIAGAALAGVKTFASAASAVTRALVTAQQDGERMLLLRRPAAGWTLAGKPDLHGMRGAGTAAVDLTGLPAPHGALIGRAGDYMRQPEISLGAWRTLAVLSGGLSALVDAVRAELLARKRAAHPQQRARLADCLAAEETARLWVERAARLAETQADEAAAAYVKLARLAVDDACVRVIQLAQRSAGLAAFARPHPIERLCRDLATYLRQPALDEVIDEAAAHDLGCAGPQ